MTHHAKGFTLIELMIVVAIIAILSAIAIPQYQKYIVKTQMTRVVAELATIRTPFEICMSNAELVEGTGPGQCDLQGTISNLLIARSNVSISTTGFVEGTIGNTSALVLTGAMVTWRRSAAGSWSCEVKASTDPGFPVNSVPPNCVIVP